MKLIWYNELPAVFLFIIEFVFNKWRSLLKCDIFAAKSHQRTSWHSKIIGEHVFFSMYDCENKLYWRIQPAFRLQKYTTNSSKYSQSQSCLQCNTQSQTQSWTKECTIRLTEQTECCKRIHSNTCTHISIDHFWLFPSEFIGLLCSASLLIGTVHPNHSNNN